MTLVSTEETAQHGLRPHNLQVLPGFIGIYGEAHKLLRGLRYAVSLQKIIFWVWQYRPQIVHFHFFQVPILDYVFFKVLEKLSIRRIITVHDVVPFSHGDNVRAARHTLLHKIYQNASGLILNSSHSMAKLAELEEELTHKAIFIQQGSYTQSKPGDLIPSEQAKAAIGLKANVPVILVFGSIKRNKRLDLVLKAVNLVADSLPDLRLIVAGQTQDRDVDSDIGLAKSLGIESKVIWMLDRATDEEMMRLFSAADVVVFPYQWIYQSAALLMAMSLGKAVIATAVGSNKDVVIDGKTGLLVSPDDPAESATALLKLLTNPPYAKQLATAAQADVDIRFNWKSIAEETKRFYQKTLLQEP